MPVVCSEICEQIQPQEHAPIHQMEITASIDRTILGDGLPLKRPVPRRIALFTGAYNHIADGVSLTLNRLVEHLERDGASVLVFGPTTDDPPIAHNGTLVPAPSFMAPGRPDYRVSLGLSPRARRKLEAFQPTLFHIATPDILGYQALKLALRSNTPIVASYHTHFSSYLKYYKLGALERSMWKYLRWFYSHCDQIYVPTPSMAGVLRDNGIDSGLNLWPRGVDTSRFNPARRSIEWRRKLGISDHEVVITFVSRLVWEKGLDVFASVIESLSQDGIPHRSVIVGDGPARSAMEERLPGSIFIGYRTGEDLAKAYASSDVFLFPSETETFGNVTLEAMASGLPTVCADATGSNALVLTGNTGYLAPPQDASSFTRHVKELVLNDSLRKEMGRAAGARAREYSWNAILSRIVHYYDEVLGRIPSLTLDPVTACELTLVRSARPVSSSI